MPSKKLSKLIADGADIPDHPMKTRSMGKRKTEVSFFANHRESKRHQIQQDVAFAKLCKDMEVKEKAEVESFTLKDSPSADDSPSSKSSEEENSVEEGEVAASSEGAEKL